MFQNSDIEIYFLKNVVRIVIACSFTMAKKITGAFHHLTGRAL